MWQFYYEQDKMRLGFYLVSMLRSIHGISFSEAQEIGELLASSAMKFKNASGNYEEIALPDLLLAYSKIQKATGRSFDPEKAARAELAWWVARRSNKNSNEEVGGKIAELYAILYGGDKEEFHKAGLLRARAAKVRDKGKENADWKEIENILKESYSDLEKGIK